MSLPTEPFDQFYDRHAGGVLAVIRSVMRNTDDAEDVLQEVFLQAWSQVNRYEPARGSVEAWLLTIARSRAIDRLRAKPRREGSLGGDDGICCDDADALACVLAVEDIGAMRRALAQLTAGQREVLSLVYDEGLSHSRIATLLCLPLGTVKTRIRSALRLLRGHAANGRRTVHRAPVEDSTAGPPFTVKVGSPLSSSAWAMFDVDARLRSRLQGLQIVIVDDDAGTLSLVQAVFGRFDVSASMHVSARSGMAAMRETMPHVLLADLDMPGEDGYSLIAQARAMARGAGVTLPVAAFTGRDNEQERSRTCLAGFDAYLTKPLHPLALLSAVARLGERRVA